MTAKLTYFYIMGLGEPVRLVLSAAKIKFIDDRITKEQWDKLKPTLKWPHLPRLEIDGMVLYQCRAMCRYIARKCGLTGSNEKEELLIDMTVDALEDMRYKVINIYYTPDSPQREQGLKNATETVVPFYFRNFEEQLKENNGYLVGGKLTWADLMFISHADYMCHLLDKDMLAEYPQLKQYLNKIKKIPDIKECVDSRPKQPKDLRGSF